MKSSKAIPFIFTSLLCGIGIVGFYKPFYPHPWNATRLSFLEFPPFPLSVLVIMACILSAGMFLGTMARKYAVQVQSTLQIRFATTGIFLNAIILILSVLNLVAMFTPRTITGVVDFKIKIEERGYICVTEIEAENLWSEEVNFNDNTVIYEQSQKVEQHKEIISVDAIQPGQVVEIRYIDNDTSILGIQSLSITILKGQYRPYKNENCGSLLE